MKSLDFLIGRQFRRTKYGLSIWTDVITDVWIRWHIIKIDDIRPEVMIKGSTHSFTMEEITIIDKPLVPMEKLQIQKLEWVSKRKEEYADKIQKTP